RHDMKRDILPGVSDVGISLRLDRSKPVAVMAAYDQRGAQTLQACDDASLSVPRHVQVLGVDDDPVFCDFSRPTLTSLSTSQVRKGEVAAMALARLMDDARAERQVIKLKDAEIVERESTAPIAPAAHLIERAMAFVERQATSGIRARDVVAHLGVSQALVSQRFREFGCRTLSDALARAKLKAVRQKLRTTQLKIGAITAACGFPNADYAARLFRKTYGLTMREYRRSLAARAPTHGHAKPTR
ncbi:MAG: substrate-binding domain-containing protein, partial [bacterium]|nr:substrate-binding domain-containing protein [bacterium]